MWSRLILSVWTTCAVAFDPIDSDNRIDQVELPSCDALLRAASSPSATAPVPVTGSALEGRWVSQGCETRSGPKFVTRSYNFSRNGDFRLDLHRYGDAACTVPAFSVSVEGKLVIERASLITPGATETDYAIRRLTVRPHTNSSIEEIAQTLNKSGCPPAVYKKMKVRETTVLYNSPWHSNEVGLYTLDCTLISTWNELQLVRAEQTLKMLGQGGRKPPCRRRELFLGDIHSDPLRQNEYRPTAYQQSLSNTECISDCEHCKVVNESSLSFPPILKVSRRLLPPSIMDGSWTSVRCESQRFGFFLTRFLAFSSYRPHWHLRQNYFDDPDCRNGTYTIQASGTYKKRGPSFELDADNYDFTINKMVITPNTKHFAAQLNKIPRKLCGRGHWNEGKPSDITKTRGCPQIGLKVPSKEPEILRLQEVRGEILLFLGQTPTWPHRGQKMPPRPTSYSSPLQKCVEDRKTKDNELRPQVGARVGMSADARQVYGSSLYKILAIFFLFFRFAT